MFRLDAEGLEHPMDHSKCQQDQVDYNENIHHFRINIKFYVNNALIGLKVFFTDLVM